MRSQIKISVSEFSKEFETCDLKNTFLLDKDSANNLWKTLVDESFKPFHLLDKTHWVNTIPKKNIANWLASYNIDDYETIANILDKEIDWDDNEELFFIMSRYFIIKTNWIDFKNAWINFLMCEDESPILLNEKDIKSFLTFAPMGYVYKHLGQYGLKHTKDLS